jgi:hypothetical protein
LPAGDVNSSSVLTFLKAGFGRLNGIYFCRFCPRKCKINLSTYYKTLFLELILNGNSNKEGE